MNIIIRELKSNVKSLLIWSAITILFIFMGMAKFSAFATDPELLSVMDKLPAVLLETFQINAFNLTTVSGFFGVMFAYLALIVSINAVLLGSDIISKEERDKTVEFSLTLPISRQKLITGKLIASVILCISFILIIWGSSIVLSSSYHPDTAFYNFLSIYILGLFLIQMIFLSIGFLLGCSMQQFKRASSLAVSLLLGTYFISVLSEMNETFEILKYFTPFKFVDPLLLLNESRFEVVFLWISLGIIIFSLGGAYLSYSKRDLYI